jgi:hypothetical protein
MLYPLSYGRSDAHSNSPDAASQDPDHSTEKLSKTPLDSGLSSSTGSESAIEIILQVWPILSQTIRLNGPDTRKGWLYEVGKSFIPNCSGIEASPD